MKADAILPDLQSCLLCEDVRCEFNGMQTLVGVVNVIPAQSLPVIYLRLCIWSRWCSRGAIHLRTATISSGKNQNRALARKHREV